MKKLIAIALCVALMTTTLAAQQQRLEPKKEYNFTVVKELPITPVKDQASSGTCWCYSALSFIESEILRMGGPEVDLAEMYVVSKAYADKGIEAKVAADGKILLVRGDAKPKLELSGDGGILANGANVQLTLTEDQAEMKAQGSGLTVKQNEGEFKGGTASVTCKNGEVDVNPGGGGTVKLGSMVSVKNGEINGQGVLQVGASMIKIG